MGENVIVVFICTRNHLHSVVRERQCIDSNCETVLTKEKIFLRWLRYSIDNLSRSALLGGDVHATAALFVQTAQEGEWDTVEADRRLISIIMKNVIGMPISE